MKLEQRHDLALVYNTLRVYRNRIMWCYESDDWFPIRADLLECPPFDLSPIESKLPKEVRAIFFGMKKHKLSSDANWSVMWTFFIKLYSIRCLSELSNEVSKNI